MKEEQKKKYVTPMMEEIKFCYKEMLLSGSSEDPEEASDPDGALYFD